MEFFADSALYKSRVDNSKQSDVPLYDIIMYWCEFMNASRYISIYVYRSESNFIICIYVYRSESNFIICISVSLLLKYYKAKIYITQKDQKFALKNKITKQLHETWFMTTAETEQSNVFCS